MKIPRNLIKRIAKENINCRISKDALDEVGERVYNYITALTATAEKFLDKRKTILARDIKKADEELKAASKL